MPVTDAELNLIFRYVDNELSDEEAQQLIQQIQQNPELQKAFDQQILMSQFFQKEKEAGVSNPVTESADVYLDRMNRIAGSGAGTEPAITPMPGKRWQRLAAAAAIAAMVFTATVYFLNNRKDVPAPVVKLREKKTIPSTKDSVVLMPDTTRLLADNNLPVQLSADYYAVLPKNSLEVPTAATQYRWNYEHGQYTKMAAMDENSLITKGQNSPGEQQDIINYFNFYKALSNIQINKTNSAEDLLKRLMVKSHLDKKLSNHVKWYLLIAYLKNKKRKDALQMAESIATDPGNPYRAMAAEIQVRLIY